MNQSSKPKLLIAGSGKSVMRWSVIALICLSIFLGVSGMIVQFTVAWKGNNLDWTGFALFIGSVTSLAGAAITGKWAQKKIESSYDRSLNETQINQTDV